MKPFLKIINILLAVLSIVGTLMGLLYIKDVAAALAVFKLNLSKLLCGIIVITAGFAGFSLFASLAFLVHNQEMRSETDDRRSSLLTQTRLLSEISSNTKSIGTYLKPGGK